MGDFLVNVIGRSRGRQEGPKVLPCGSRSVVEVRVEDVDDAERGFLPAG
jgi:hypothetical protein